MFKSILSRLIGAAAVAASALLPDGLVPGSADEALGMGALLAVYGVLHKVIDGATGAGKDDGS